MDIAMGNTFVKCVAWYGYGGLVTEAKPLLIYQLLIDLPINQKPILLCACLKFCTEKIEER